MSSLPIMEIGCDKIEKFEDFFDGYTAGFVFSDPVDVENISMKIKHTKRVMEEITLLGSELGLGAGAMFTARLCALLHDIGRFEQYRRFKSFLDMKTVDHAALSVEIIDQQNILEGLDAAFADLVRTVVFNHNKASVNQDQQPDVLFFTKLLRDADKLDIWEVIIGYYTDTEFDNPVIRHGLEDSDGFSPEVFEDIMNEHTVPSSHIKNVNDLKLLQVGWIYDINFVPALRQIKKRGYMPRLLATVNSGKGTQGFLDKVNAYLDERTAS